jgi:hypothetical protein
MLELKPVNLKCTANSGEGEGAKERRSEGAPAEMGKQKSRSPKLEVIVITLIIN